MQLLTLLRVVVLATEAASTLQELLARDPQAPASFTTRCIQKCIGHSIRPFADLRSAECTFFERNFDCTFYCIFNGKK